MLSQTGRCFTQHWVSGRASLKTQYHRKAMNETQKAARKLHKYEHSWSRTWSKKLSWGETEYQQARGKQQEAVRHEAGKVTRTLSERTLQHMIKKIYCSKVIAGAGNSEMKLNVVEVSFWLLNGEVLGVASWSQRKEALIVAPEFTRMTRTRKDKDRSPGDGAKWIYVIWPG